VTCKNSIVFPIISAKCKLLKNHRGRCKWEYKDKESIVIVKWKGKNVPIP